MTRPVPQQWLLLFENIQQARALLDQYNNQIVSGDTCVDAAAYLTALEAAVAEAEGAGSVGLQDLFYLLQAQAEALSEADVPDPAGLSLQLQALDLIMAFMRSELEAAVLLKHFQDEGWASPLADDDVEMFLEMLALPAEVDDEPGDEKEPELSLDFSDEQAGGDEQVVRQEVITLLQSEVQAFAKAVARFLDEAAGQANDGNGWQHAFNAAADELEHFSTAAAAVQMEGLAEICFYLSENFRAFAERNQPPSKQERALIDSWPDQIERYLKAVNDLDVCFGLAVYLSDSAWPTPLPEDDADPLVELLAAPVIASEPVAEQARQVSATAEDVSLALPGDVNPDLLDALLQELPQQTSEFSSAIKKLVEGEGSLEDVKLAQRVAHSLKGAGNTVGIRGIANLTHHLEDILQAFFEHDRLPQGELANVLMDASDCLEAMSESILGMGAAPEHAEQTLQSVLDWANRIDAEGLDSLGIAQPAPSPDVSSSPQIPAAPAAIEPAPVASTRGNMVRVPAELMDELLRLGGEGIIVTGQVKNRVKQMRQQARALREQYRMAQQLAYELEQLVSVSGVLASSTAVVAAGADSVEIEQYNELHSCLSRLEESIADSKEFADALHEDLYVMEDLIIEQERFQKDNQEAIYRSRMVPVSTIVPRCERGVRQACRLTEKSVDFRIEGAETMMDSQVLSDFVEPLMHLLRNSVDHGIETAEQRRAAGKPETGSITLRFARVGDLIEVTCQDDGAGLDTGRIKETAIAKGVITEADELSEAEINQLILLPGFTTKGEATQVSGRGIGMDAVYAKIKEMKGGLSLHSRRGEGLKVVLHLPVSMLSVSATLVKSGDVQVAISNYGVEQVVDVVQGTLREGDNGMVFDYQDEEIPAIYLELLMGRQVRSRDHQAVFIVQPDVGSKRAVVVDSVAHKGEMVVKNMGAYLPQIAGVVGVTILGDGSVAPVLDIPELLRSEKHGHAIYQPIRKEAVVSSQRSALVVDDSLSARRALASFLEDSGFEVRTAIDGLDALELIKERTPDIVLVDMEMPRMNGIELTSQLKADETTRNLPVIMITSRSTAKHRSQAEEAGVDDYLIKPFNEVELESRIDTLLGNSLS